jgi:hypothetical protein
MPNIAPEREPQERGGLWSTQEKHQLVQRVVDSRMFRRSSALCAFLLYITNHEILGQADKLKEHTIGVEALGRKPDYAPLNDNIVRVRAHELRGRLERYFASEGANESIVITIPVGGYAPKFVPRKSLMTEAPASAPVAETVLLANDNGRRQQRHWLPFAAVALIALSVSVWLIRYTLRSDSRVSVVRSAAATSDFWGQFFDKPHEELQVVYADPGFALWQDLNSKDLNLGDYLNQKYLNNSDKLLQLAVRRVASPADIAIATHLGTLAGQFGGQINLQFARDVSSQFFQRGNVVLIGSRHSNPWVESYEPNLNFTLSQDPNSKAPLFRNRSPRHGEDSVYTIPAVFDRPGAGISETEYKSYGVIALLKSCGNRGLTVILEGLNTQATRAVGDMLTDQQRLDILLQGIGHKPGAKVTPFEALIQVTSLPNNYSDPKVVAFRIKPSGSCAGN